MPVSPQLADAGRTHKPSQYFRRQSWNALHAGDIGTRPRLRVTLGTPIRENRRFAFFVSHRCVYASKIAFMRRTANPQSVLIQARFVNPGMDQDPHAPCTGSGMTVMTEHQPPYTTARHI
jgi:hypothetical protein